MAEKKLDTLLKNIRGKRYEVGKSIGYMETDRSRLALATMQLITARVCFARLEWDLRSSVARDKVKPEEFMASYLRLSGVVNSSEIYATSCHGAENLGLNCNALEFALHELDKYLGQDGEDRQLDLAQQELVAGARTALTEARAACAEFWEMKQTKEAVVRDSKNMDSIVFLRHYDHKGSRYP